MSSSKLYIRVFGKNGVLILTKEEYERGLDRENHGVDDIVYSEELLFNNKAEQVLKKMFDYLDRVLLDKKGENNNGT